MPAGRPRKPKAEKKLQGTYRKNQDYDALPAPITNDIPTPPNFLTKNATEYYFSICHTLRDLKILSPADMVVVIQLAQTLDLNERSYLETTKTEGYKQTSATGFETYSAAFSVWEKTSKTIRDLSNMLGLSPAARERIKIKNEDKQENELMKILGE